MCMTDAGMTQDYFILPAPPVGGLPISQDWLDRMKLVRDRTIPIILPNDINTCLDIDCVHDFKCVVIDVSEFSRCLKIIFSMYY